MPKPDDKSKQESKALKAAKAWAAALPEKQRKKVEADLAADPEYAEAVGQGVLAQSDYTRGIQEARAKQLEAEELSKKLLTQKAGLDKYYEENVGKVDQILKENEKLKGKAVAYETRMERLRTKYGFDAEEIKDLIETKTGEGDGAGSGTKPENLESGANVGGKGQDRKQYVDHDTFNQSLNSTTSLAAQFTDIKDDHAELFPGQRLNFSDEKTGLLARAQKYAADHPDEEVTLRSFWEQEYKVAERRAALAAEEFDKKVNDTVEERWKEKVSEAARNGVNFDGRSPGRASEGSPLLGALKPKLSEDGKPILAEPGDPNRGVNAAIQLWQSGELQKQATDLAGAGINKL